MCAACRARDGDAPPVRSARERTDRLPARAAEPDATTPGRSAPQREDRVRRALHELPKGEYTTGRIAKAAGLNHAKALRRLRQLAASGEIRQVSKRATTRGVACALPERTCAPDPASRRHRRLSTKSGYRLPTTAETIGARRYFPGNGHDRVQERRRAAALARHYRDQEGLTIAEIGRRLSRAEGTAKAYL